MSQPVWMAKMGRLLRALGDPDPALGNMERSVVPVVLVGDGREVTPPLRAPASYFGGFKVGGGTAATAPSFTVTSRAAGGSWLHWFSSSDTNGQVSWKINAAPVALAGAVALTPQNVIDGGAAFTAFHGTTADASFIIGELPSVRQSASQWAEMWVHVPNGETFQITHSVNTAFLFVQAAIRNVEENSRL